ncbi:MAG: PilN domain-containing protein [Phycisphaerae bacterium]|nr:PilN domain-containing protein [Phycisphaerae bacterium]MBN8596410.1 PilN domain-containing protein [Planctomycetota bacterium]
MNPFLRQNNETPAGTSFLPEDYVEKQSSSRANALALGLFAIVMVGVIAAFFVTTRRWETVRAEQSKINELYAQEAKKIEQLKALESQRSQMLDKAEITTALTERIPRSALLEQIVNRCPDDSLAFSELELKSKRIEPPKEVIKADGKAPAVKSLTDAKKDPKDEKKDPVRAPKFEYSLTINGLAQRNTDVTDFLSKLGECNLLDRPDLPFIDTVKIDQTTFRKFQITAGLNSAADARIVLPVAQAETTKGAPAPKATAGADAKTND